ncbi:hypothetical protein ABH931_000677 [Streptacidiphilus sp. MAP12-33]|uniref:hypothetical protein n=1 Tax=Streptacidiphilus sp. MAP12-33 TaxID=3156266 RepID=UPI003513CC99
MGIRPTYAPGSNQTYTVQPYQPVPVAPPAHQQVCTCPDHGNTPAAPVYYAPASAPAQSPSIAPYVAGGIGAVVAVVTVGAIAIGLLLAFALSALALAVVAAVLKSLLNDVQNRPRR